MPRLGGLLCPDHKSAFANTKDFLRHFKNQHAYDFLTYSEGRLCPFPECDVLLSADDLADVDKTASHFLTHFKSQHRGGVLGDEIKVGIGVADDISAADEAESDSIGSDFDSDIGSEANESDSMGSEFDWDSGSDFDWDIERADSPVAMDDRPAAR